MKTTKIGREKNHLFGKSVEDTAQKGKAQNRMKKGRTQIDRKNTWSKYVASGKYAVENS